MSKWGIFGLLLFCSTQLASGQQLNRYMVFFTDKAPCESVLNSPASFLSERSLQRREAQHITVQLADIPVCDEYLQEIRPLVAQVLYTTRWWNGALVEAEEEQSLQLQALPYVQKVEYIAPGPKPEAQIHQSKTYREPSLRQALNAPPQFEMLGVPAMHAAGFTGKGKLLAIFDAGFTQVNELDVFDHLYRTKQVVATHNFVSRTDSVYYRSTHGTKALSTILAVDSANYMGVAPEAELAMAITEDIASEYRIEEYNWLIAAEWADSLGADVISSSLGYSSFDDPAMDYSYSQLDGQSSVSARAVKAASERGILVVVSAGNAGATSWRYLNTPADAPDALAVGAVTSTGDKASFSSFGPSSDGRIKPDVAAMGQATLVAAAPSGFTTSNGTSFSAPQVAGLALALWQAFPALRSYELAAYIRQAGSQAAQPDTLLGYGIPSFERFRTLVGTPEEDELVLSLYPNPVQTGKVYLRLRGKPAVTRLQLFDALGHRLMQDIAPRPEHRGEDGYIYSLPIDSLRMGIYLLSLEIGGRKEHLRLIKL